MRFMPQTKVEWVQQLKLAVLVLALSGYAFFLVEGLSSGLGVYRHPTYCWVATGFAFVTLIVASPPQRWIAILAIVAGVLSAIYGYHENANWRERLKVLNSQTKVYVVTQGEALL